MFAYEDFYNDGDGRYEGIEDAKIVGIMPTFNDKIMVTYKSDLKSFNNIERFSNHSQTPLNFVWDPISDF